LSLVALRPALRPRVELQMSGEDCPWVKHRLELSLPAAPK